jgi:signal transduction histidine kinase
VLLGFTFFVGIVIQDFLHDNYIIRTGYYTHYGLVVFIFSQAYLITSRFAKAFHDVQDLTQNLEKKVELRTQELEQQHTEIKQLHDSLSHQKERLELIQKVSHEIQNAKSFDQMCDNLKKALFEFYKIEVYMFYLVNSSTKCLEFHRIESIVEIPQDIFDLLSQNLIPYDSKNSTHGFVILTKKPLYSKGINRNRVSKEELLNIELVDISSIFILPLLSNGEVFGVISFPDVNPKYGTKHRVKNLLKSKRKDLELLSQSIANTLFQSLQKKQIESTQEALSRAERSASLNSMVSHLAHEVNNPLNYISTGETITKESVQEAKSFILGAIPDSPESRPFVDKIKALFEEIDLGIKQSGKGTVRIRDTIQEIRAITGVDGIHVDNFDLLPLLYSNWELTLEKNQVPNGLVALEVNGMSWPERFPESMIVLSQKYIFSRAIRTLLNNCIHFAKKNSHPKIQIDFYPIKSKEGQVITISIRNNGPAIEEGKEVKLFDLKSSKYFGTELIGLPFVKEILKSVQCNLSLTDNGRTSGWVEFQVIMKEYR